LKEQWSPRCSQQIKEIYDNHPKKGNSFLEPKLNALYEEFRYKRAEDLSNSIQNLRSKLKPEILEEEAKCQLNFKLTKKNAQKIEYLKGKLGLTDSELITIVVLREEPSVEEGKETPETAEAKRLEVEAPSEEKPPTIREETINEKIEKLLKHRQVCYQDCVSEPFKDKNGRWMINCSKPLFKKDRYGNRIPTGKLWGVISIENCLSQQSYWIRRQIRKELEEKERVEKKAKEEVAEEEEAPQLSIPKKPELSIQEIVDQVGLCKNPILMSQRTLLCPSCKKRHPDKWQACQEIQGEIDEKKSPLGSYKFLKAMTQRVIEERKAREDPYWWWGSPKTEDMTLEEIEKDLGLRSNSSSHEDLKFDAYRKRYHEICETCEEHLHHRCTRYCRDFLNGLGLPQEQAS